MSIRKAKKNWKKFLQFVNEVFEKTDYNIVEIDYEKNVINFKKKC